MDAAITAHVPVPVPLVRRRPPLVFLLAVAVAAMAVAGAISMAGARTDPGLVAVARAAIVGVPIAVGAYARYRRPGERFGLLIVGAGGVALLTTLAESPASGLYTAGRAAGWLMELLIVYIVLAFPNGRLTTRVDRLLVAALGLVVLTLYVPYLALASQFPLPSPWTSCVRDCPQNPLLVFDHEPAIVGGAIEPLGTLLVVVLMIGVSARLWQRMRNGTSMTHRMFAPLWVVATARPAILAVGIWIRHADPSAPALQVVAWLLALAVPAIALAFLVGLLRWRLLAARALERLAVSLRTTPDCVALRRAFAEAFGDPQVQLAFPAARSGDRWVDCSGEPAPIPRSGQGRAVTEVRRRGTVVAVLVHDQALSAEPELLDAGAALVGVALANSSLTAEAEGAARELRRSRARIAATAESERRRIERDLHDGAQQRLVALRIELQLARDLVRRDPEGGAVRLEELEGEVDEAIEEIRSLAHGVYPALLSDRGLVEALRAAQSTSPTWVELDVHGVGRYVPEVEGAVYFCVLEAIQNVLKHATGSQRVVVSLDGSRDSELWFSVRDDGAGTEDGTLQAGTGITNMRDRMAAVGASLEITSTPGVGTVVRGRVPTTRR